MRTVAITFIVLMLISIPAWFWLSREVLHTPQFKAYQTCREHFEEVNKAFGRYVVRYDKYPATLDDLYPDFIENRNILHCPLDRGEADSISYQYNRPEMSAPGSNVILECRRHVVIKQLPAVISMRKDGSFVSVQMESLNKRRK